MKYYKFVEWEAAPIENVMQANIPKALAEYDNGNKEPFHAMKMATMTPFYKLGGWCFDLRPYLRRYWVKTKYYGILEYFAINKTAIRGELKSNIIEIMEVK